MNYNGSKEIVLPEDQDDEDSTNQVDSKVDELQGKEVDGHEVTESSLEISSKKGA